MDELEFRYNLELYPHWTLSSYINDLFSYVYNKNQSTNQPYFMNIIININIF